MHVFPKMLKSYNGIFLTVKYTINISLIFRVHAEGKTASSSLILIMFLYVVFFPTGSKNGLTFDVFMMEKLV